MSFTAPAIPAAINGRLGYFAIKNGIQAIINKYDTARHGDIISLNWGDEFTVEKFISATDEDFPLVFNVSELFPLTCLYNGTYNISYTVLDSHGNSYVSDILALTVSSMCQ